MYFLLTCIQRNGPSATVIFTMLIQILICILRGKVVLVHVFIAYYMHSVIALHLHIHTFTYTYIITSFHNQLKTVHLNGKVNRRVDVLLHHLMKYEKDMFFNYKRVRQLLPAMGDRMKKDLSRHELGMQIPTKDVEVSYMACN